MNASRRMIVGVLAFLVAGFALPTAPASAAGTTYEFTALTQNQRVAFDPVVDVLHFDGTVPASSVFLADSYNGYLILGSGSKQVLLNGVTPDELSTTNMAFADGSLLCVGDGSSSATGDSDAQTWDLSASTKKNQLMGLGGADHLIGGSSGDRMVGTPTYGAVPGPATLEGGPGDDRYAIDPSKGDVIVEQTAGGTDTVEAAGTYAFTSPNLENLALTGSADSAGTGNDGPNVLVGNEGRNHLYGLGGADTLVQGSTDTLEGGVGNDTYLVTSQSYSIVEPVGGGTDSLRTTISGTLPANVENGTLTNTLSESLTGNALNNILVGNSGNNGMSGAAGVDTLTGGAGADTFGAPATEGIDIVTDFASRSDRVMTDFNWAIGRDIPDFLRRKTNVTGPGGFSVWSNVVVITRNVGSLTMTNAAGVIGSATSKYDRGDRRIFVVDNGTTSQVLRFASSGADAKVSASELRAMLTIRNRTGLSVNDIVIGG
jgi:Ca2+-binding RTX toxin-like protein